jgi:hypothetical protein
MVMGAHFGSPYAISVLAIDVFDVTQRNRSLNSMVVRDETLVALVEGAVRIIAGSSRVQHSSHPRP